MKIEDIRIECYTEQGPREENQDSYCIKQGKETVTVAVCDGLGGHDNGRQTSNLVSELIAESEEHMAWEEIIQEANDKVKEMKEQGYTTVAAIRFRQEKEEIYAELCNCGDSRIYLFRDKAYTQISKDHTTQRELMAYGVSEEKALANRKLTSCVGMDSIELYLCEKDIVKGDVFLLATDGVWELLLEKGEFGRISCLRTAEEKVRYIKSQLQFYVNELEDNATFVIAYLPD